MNPKPSLRQTGYGYQGLIVTEIVGPKRQGQLSQKWGSLSPTAFSFKVSVEILPKQESCVCVFCFLFF